MTAHARKTPGSNVASPKTAGAASFILNVDTPAGAIAVTVARKRVRNLNLRVRGDGSVVASIPLHTSATRAQAFLDRRASWIAQHVLRHREQAELERDTTHAPSTILVGRARLVREGVRIRPPAGKRRRRSRGPRCRALPAGSETGATRRRRASGAPDGCSRQPMAGARHEDSLGLLHAAHQGHSHQCAPCGVSAHAWNSLLPTSSATSWNRATTSAFIRCSISTAPRIAQSPPCSKSPREPQRVRRHRPRGSTRLRRDTCTRNETTVRQRDGRSQQLKPSAPWLLHRDYWLLAASPKTYRLEVRISLSMQLIYLREY